MRWLTSCVLRDKSIISLSKTVFVIHYALSIFLVLPYNDITTIYKILFHRLVRDSSIDKSAIIDEQLDVELHRLPTSKGIGRSACLARLNQSGTGDRTSGFSVFAWHARHQSLVAVLASIRSSLDHPVETAYTNVRPANCIASSVTATIVTSFKFRLCLSPS